MTTPSVGPPSLSAREGQLRSSFTAIFETLCASCTGALAAVLVDEDGESVDHASLPLVSQHAVVPSMQAFAIKLAAAHWQIVMRQAHDCLGAVRQLWVQSAALGYVVQQLSAGYVMVFVCRPGALSTVSHRALRQCEVELSLEAGWAVHAPESPCWTRTRVKLDREARQWALWFAGRWLSGFEIRGPLPALGDFERGYELAVAGGLRVALVREPTGLWYAGTALASVPARHPFRGSPTA